MTRVRNMSLRLSVALVAVSGTAPLHAGEILVAAAADRAEGDAGAPPVAAEEPAQVGGDIVVTARRREERAQDVPIALSVVSNEALAARGDYRLDQVQQLVPSLQVFSFNPRNTNINIRGLGSNVALTNDGLENGVGVYIDNVYYGRVGSSQFDLVDLDRVEVLRGPQGTLFGKNTTAGAINITSRAPSFMPDFSGEVQLGDYGYHQLRTSVSGPLIADLLAARISIADTHRDGFVRNPRTGERLQDYDNVSVRGQLLLTPAAGLNVRVIGDYQDQQQACCTNLLVSQFTTYENGNRIANNFTDRVTRLGYTPLPFRPFDRLTDIDSEIRANMNSWGVSAQADFDAGPASITSITALRNWNWYPLNDSDYIGQPIVLANNLINHQRQFSQELRLASNGTHRVDYVVGAYYFWQVVRGIGSSAYGAAAPLALFPGDDQVVARAAAAGFSTAGRSDPHTESVAAFGQAVFHITPRLDLTAGLRFTHERKWGSYSSSFATGASLAGLSAAQRTRAQAIRDSLSPVQSFDAEAKDDSLSWLATLGWKPADDALIYATYSRGSKSQGLNLTNLPAGVNAVVDPEKVDNYEVGLKSQFFNRAVTLNLAAYWTEVSNYQTTIVQQVVGTNRYVNYIANIPKARSRGVEGDLAWRAAEWASFTASASYTDATYRDYPNGPTPVEALNPTPTNTAGTPSRDFAGQRLAGVPEWAASVGGDLTAPLDAGADLYGHADWSWRSNYSTVASNSRYGIVPGYDVVNARIGIRLDDGRFDLSVWARNLLDKDYFQTLGVQNYGLVTGTLGDPRTLGVTFRTRL